MFLFYIYTTWEFWPPIPLLFGPQLCWTFSSGLDKLQPFSFHFSFNIFWNYILFLFHVPSVSVLKTKLTLKYLTDPTFKLFPVNVLHPNFIVFLNILYVWRQMATPTIAMINWKSCHIRFVLEIQSQAAKTYIHLCSFIPTAKLVMRTYFNILFQNFASPYIITTWHIR